MIGISDLFHSFYHQAFSWHPQGYYDINTRYWIFGRFIEALLFLIATRKLYRINRYLGSLFAFSFALGVCLLILYYPQAFPVLLIEGSGVTTVKVVLEYIIISLYIVSVYFFAREIKMGNSSPTNKYLILALLFAIPAEICFTLYVTVTDHYQVLGHILKIACYYYIFKGIFVNSIIHPYQQLKTSQAYINKVISNFPMAIATFDYDSKLTFLNTRAREILGCGNDDLLGQSLRNGISKFHIRPWEHGISMENPQKTKINICNLTNNENKDYILRYDYYHLSEFGFMYIFEDAKKEQELENLQIQTTTLLNSITNIVAICNDHHEVLLCNKPFLDILEAEKQAIIGQSILAIGKDLSFKYTKEAVTRDTSSLSTSHHFEASISSFKGQKKFISASYAPIYNVENEKIGYIFVGSDITGKELLREKLEQQEKLAILGQMAAGIVHEIKNPLTSIKGFNQMISDRTNEDLTKEFSQIIAEEVESLNKVVTDFLAFAKPRKPLLKEVSLSMLVQSIETMIETQLFLKRIGFELILSETEYTVFADDSQLKQVILNLVKNAIDAMESAPQPKLTITLDYVQDSGEMRISIKDNGKGISTHEKQRIGTPFFTTKEKGTGLGLSVCYQIIKENKGSLCFESEPQQGTTFYISLPCTSQALSGELEDSNVSINPNINMDVNAIA